mgnify:CR=1 FL=1
MLIKTSDPSSQPAPRRAADDDVSTINAKKYELLEGEVVSIALGKCYPTAVQDVCAESLCRILNAQIAHDGSWRVVWRDPVARRYDPSSMLFRTHLPTVLQCQYLDQDGDVWCCVNIDDDVADIIEAGVSTWVEKCEEAYQWVRHLRNDVVDLRAGKDTKQAAKGESLTENTDAVLPARTGLH